MSTAAVDQKLRKLQKATQESLAILEKQLASSNDGTSAATHMADLSQGMEGRYVLHEQIACLNNTLELTQAARDRIKAGKYGLCASCGNPIAPERLKVQPYALLCLGCMNIAEKKEAARPRRRT